MSTITIIYLRQAAATCAAERVWKCGWITSTAIVANMHSAWDVFDYWKFTPIPDSIAIIRTAHVQLETATEMLKNHTKNATLATPPKK